MCDNRNFASTHQYLHNSNTFNKITFNRANNYELLFDDCKCTVVTHENKSCTRDRREVNYHKQAGDCPHRYSSRNLPSLKHYSHDLKIQVQNERLQCVPFKTFLF